jgi:hypothetical protein
MERLGGENTRLVVECAQLGAQLEARAADLSATKDASAKLQVGRLGWAGLGCGGL